MSEKQYRDDDYEVISMVNRKAGRGGELPGKAIHFIPEETAPHVLAIDRRIQQIRRYQGLLICAAIVLAFMIGVMA